MKYLLLIFVICTSEFSIAQVTSGMVAYYPFDNSDFNDYSGNNYNGTAIGFPGFTDCGVKGKALSMDGFDDELFLGGLFNDILRTSNFSLSFYFKFTGAGAGTRTLFSKRSNCTQDSSFAIRYTPLSNSINVELWETPLKKNVITYHLDNERCWQHIVVVRNSSSTALWVNGVQVAQDFANPPSRVDITNLQPLEISGGPCINSGLDGRFKGFLDEIRVYDRALKDEEIKLLYYSPEQLINRDTIIFLGGSVTTDVILDPTCYLPNVYNFQWSPIVGVSDPTKPITTLTPTETTTYHLKMSDGFCQADDTIHVIVVDPSTLDCSTVYMPNAFTPNGDGHNDRYGISNPYALEKVISFEIFDRWGERVFQAQNPLDTWDGNLRNVPVNPGNVFIQSCLLV